MIKLQCQLLQLLAVSIIACACIAYTINDTVTKYSFECVHFAECE